MAATIRPIALAHEPSSRPLGIGVLAAADAAIGGLVATAGLVAMGAGRAIAPTATAQLAALPIPAPAIPALLFGFGALLLASGALLLVQSGGLWHGRGWAWALAVALAALHGVGDLGAIAGQGVTSGTVVGLAFVVAILAYLNRPAVGAYFGQASARR